ncbi:MAG: hypothetical protein ACR2FG_01755 [Marmoricola sp.]
MTITVINSNFGVLDSVVFFLGLAGLLTFAVSFSVHLSARTTGVARVGLGVLAFVVVIAALGGLSYVADLLGRHVSSTANVGLHGE